MLGTMAAWVWVRHSVADAPGDRLEADLRAAGGLPEPKEAGVRAVPPGGAVGGRAREQRNDYRRLQELATEQASRMEKLVAALRKQQDDHRALQDRVSGLLRLEKPGVTPPKENSDVSPDQREPFLTTNLRTGTPPAPFTWCPVNLRLASDPAMVQIDERPDVSRRPSNTTCQSKPG